MAGKDKQQYRTIVTKAQGFVLDLVEAGRMSDESKQGPNNTIYRDFCNGMRNQSREQIRLAGDIARRISRGTSQARTSDLLNTVATNFCQIEVHLENTENNLNKVCALTRQTR